MSIINILYINCEPSYKTDFSESQQKSANVELTLELELFDSIEIGKRYASANAANKNFFEGRMIP